MVGVPGKFKGCETCRLRRVKCDNTRPFCRKCRDTGRECAGYERETVFIIGTPQDGGRCSSHPPRVIKSRKTTPGSGSGGGGGGGSGSGSGSNFVGSSSASSSGKSRSSPNPGANSRSASVSTPTSNSSAASSPSISIAERYIAPSSIISSAKFDISAVPGVAQRTNALQGPSGPDLVPVQPLQSAWNDLLTLASGGIVYQVQIAALATPLQSLTRRRDSNSNHSNHSNHSSFILAPFSVYTPVAVRPPNKADDFQLSSQCMVHLTSGDSHLNFGATPTDSICLFLYEQNSPLSTSLLPAWKDPALQNNSIRQTGPARFATFPAHHFFARVYRPNAIWAALINRRSTFLSDPDWTSTPWEAHPKSGLDRLLDITVLLPVIFGRADNVTPHDPTMARRMLAQDLLANCLYVEQVLEQWHNSVQEMGARGVGGAATMNSTTAGRGGGPTGLPGAGAGGGVSHGGSGNWYWIEDPDASAAQIPFADTFAFRDSATSLMFVYYWSILVLLYPCIERLNAAIFQPVLDAFPPPYPNLPPSLQIPDTAKYGIKEVRELAANVCRGLDFALAMTVQPDLLTAPLFVVESFYREINAASGDGALELLWCEAFRSRLATKGQYIAEVVQSRRWVDAAQF